MIDQELVTKLSNPEARYDFAFLLSATQCNPNGDPATNEPRVDPSTKKGLISYQAIKRKIRDSVEVTENSDSFDIYYKDGSLNPQKKSIWEEAGRRVEEGGGNKQDHAMEIIMDRFWDIRLFGAPLTGENFRSVTGPLQFDVAKSLDAPRIVRRQLTSKSNRKNEGDRGVDEGNMGEHAVVDYGLYLGKGSYNPPKMLHDRVHRVTSEDLRVFWTNFVRGILIDSASGRNLELRDLWVFKHDSPLGSQADWQIHDGFKIERHFEGKPESYDDYTVTFRGALNDGVEMVKLV